MPTVELTRAGLRIDGVPRVLLAGQLHYFRYPRAEWRELLLIARAAGLNTIDTVIPWNLHEPLQGMYNYYDEGDLPAFLDLCGELGLWAIVRPGPYICAEWENGGFPAWLTAMLGLELRVDNPLFLEHTLRWFDQLLPLLAERQIDRGGPVILCQIENEHWASGRYGHDAHQDTLATAAIARGISVPQYTCMGGMRAWPEFRNGWSGIAEKLQQTRALWPDNPMIVSELWSGWFDNWGASRHNHKTAARLDLILHQLTAVGASGLSHWMWAGGTNFGFWGGRTVGGDTIHMTTSYDYDAPVSEFGGLTAKFYVARRHHLFLGTLGAPLSAVLADARPGGPRVIGPAAVAGRGEAGSAPYRQVQAAPGAPPAWADFSATFLHNAGPEGQTYQLFIEQPAAHLPVEVEAGAIRPIFTNLPLGESGLRLALHTGRILGFWPHAQGDTLVLYGQPGETGELRLAADGGLATEAAPPANVECATGAEGCDIRYWLTDTPTVVRLRAAGRPLAVVLLTTARAERWWPTGDAGFVCGSDLVIADGADGWQAERRGLLPFYRLAPGGQLALLDLPAEEHPTEHPTIVWASENALTQNSKLNTQHSTLLWERHGVMHLEVSEGWQPLEQPVALEQLGCDQGYGWYRALFELDGPRRVTLAAPQLNDRARVFLDGADVGWLGVHPHGPQLALDLELAAGPHDLRLMVDNLGRFNYGANTGERKGLLDTLYLDGQQEDLSAGWTALWQEAAFAGEAIAGARPAHLRPDAENVHLGRFAFQGTSVWLLREFEATPGRAYRLHLTGDRNAGALFVNGAAVARFSRHNGGGFIDQDISALVRPGTNVIALHIQGYAGLAWRATLLSYDPAQPLPARWSFAGGIMASEPVVALEAPPSGPAFYQAPFDYDPAVHGPGPFKINLAGLRKGQIWVNGRHLGRYWHLGPQEWYKLPASWLRASGNHLLIFDEEGALPTQFWVATDLAAARRLAGLET